MDNALQHHGILGMKWGVRRFQNKDGTLTDAGKRHASKMAKAAGKSYATATDVRKATSRVAREHTKEAKEWEEVAREHADKGHKIRARLSANTAKSDRDFARAAKRVGFDDAKEWVERGDYKKQKVYDFLSKYGGDSKTKTRIDNIIQQYSNVPYGYYVTDYDSYLEKQVRGY